MIKKYSILCFALIIFMLIPNIAVEARLYTRETEEVVGETPQPAKLEYNRPCDLFMEVYVPDPENFSGYVFISYYSDDGYIVTSTFSRGKGYSLSRKINAGTYHMSSVSVMYLDGMEATVSQEDFSCEKNEQVHINITVSGDGKSPEMNKDKYPSPVPVDISAAGEIVAGEGNVDAASTSIPESEEIVTSASEDENQDIRNQQDMQQKDKEDAEKSPAPETEKLQVVEHKEEIAQAEKNEIVPGVCILFFIAVIIGVIWKRVYRHRA